MNKKNKTNKNKKQKNILNEESKNTAWPFQIDSLQTWAYWDSAFTPEECKKIIEIGNKKKLIQGTILHGTTSSMRDSKIAWLYPTEELNWVYTRISQIIYDLNKKYFNFELYGFIEGFQFTHYQQPDGKYKKHVDRGLNAFIRKLSLSVQLSDPSSYEGGELLLHEEENPIIVPKEQGKLITFPSYIMHEVKPVTKGERYSLVAWITGPSFK
jgi:PKHD-type hydroxylase